MPIARKPVRERRHRLPRACYRGEIAVAFTARLITAGEPIDPAQIAQPLIAALAASATQYSCLIPVYCIMPDHVHLILAGTSTTADLWRAMASFKQRSGFWFAAHLPGTRWQKDFYDHVVRNEDELRAAIAYIARNPVRAGLVHDPADYPYTGSIGAAPDGVNSPPCDSHPIP